VGPFNRKVPLTEPFPSSRPELTVRWISKTGQQGVLFSWPPSLFFEQEENEADFNGFPGPEAGSLGTKTMRQVSFLGAGGPAVLSPLTGLLGGPAHAAEAQSSFGWNSFPADAF